MGLSTKQEIEERRIKDTAREESIAILAAAMELKRTTPQAGISHCISLVEKAFDDLLERRINTKTVRVEDSI